MCRAVNYGGPKVSRQFQFTVGNLYFTHGNLKKKVYISLNIPFSVPKSIYDLRGHPLCS